MDKELFQIAFDFFGDDPGKPEDKPVPPVEEPQPAAPEAVREEAPAPEEPVTVVPAEASEPFEVFFPEPIELPVVEGPAEFLSGAPIDADLPKPKSKRGRKSLKAGAEEAALVQVPPDEELNQKQYYGISEVAAMFGVNASLLRYWETAFGMQLRKNRKGDRFFTPQDIRTVQLIHDLLRRRKFTIDGARDFLKKNKGADQRYELIQSLQKMKKFMLELKAHL